MGKQAASEELAKSNKSRLEEEILHKERQDNFQATIDNATAWKEAAVQALEFLDGTNGICMQTSLLQSGYVPPKADRTGRTVGDLAPEKFSDTANMGNSCESIKQLLTV